MRTAAPRRLSAGRVTVREATATDNTSLLALDGACKMGRGTTWTIRHEPDFFALFRTAGVSARVGVAEREDGIIIGSVTVLGQPVTVDDAVAVLPYVSGWHVHPAYRGQWVGPALVRWATARCLEMSGSAECVGWFIRSGTGESLRDLVRRQQRDLLLSPPRTLRAYWLRTAHWRALLPAGAFDVRPANERDVSEMADLWAANASSWQLAPAYGAACLERWRASVLRVPPACYWVARARTGTLLAFLGLWDQRDIKQLRRESELLPLRVRRAIRNGVRDVAGIGHGDGAIVRSLAATHVCITADAPQAGEALLEHAARAARHAGYTNISMMLDEGDPATAICRRWCRRSMPFSAFVVTKADGRDARPPDRRPLHMEVGLA